MNVNNILSEIGIPVQNYSIGRQAWIKICYVSSYDVCYVNGSYEGFKLIIYREE